MTEHENPWDTLDTRLAEATGMISSLADANNLGSANPEYLCWALMGVRTLLDQARAAFEAIPTPRAARKCFMS